MIKTLNKASSCCKKPPGDAWQGGAPCFAADASLGRLTRYLRFLGHDALYEKSDEGLIKAWGKGRVALTRKRPLALKLKGRVFFVADNDPKAQIKAVFSAFSLTPEPRKIFSRCLLCNAKVVKIPRRQVINKVPDYVYLTANRFSTCPDCGKIYWQGSHLKRGLEFFERMVFNNRP